MSMRAIARFVLTALLACASLLPACEREKPPATPPATPTPADPERVAPPSVKPDYRFAEELRHEYPEIVAFLRQFMETSLAGDYSGYRKLVSRACDPERRERFTAILHAIRMLRIESIEPARLPDLPDESYRVVTQIELKPDSKVRLRRKTDKVAIIVLKEEGEWRMMPAPGELQPVEEEPPATASAPATSTASYPWDEDGDF